MSADLSRLPLPEVIEPLDFETILATIKADAVTAAPSLSGVISLESEPIVKLCEVFAYRELLLRSRVNHAASSVMLAYAAGSDLDHLAALFNIERAPEESDERLRERIRIAPEAFSVAGSREAYRFHAMSAHAEVIDVAPVSHSPGVVTLYVLTGHGLNEAVRAAVLEKCADAKVRPLTDQVRVTDAVPVEYAIDVKIVLDRDADEQLALDEIERAARAFREEHAGFGQSIVVSQLIDALHVYGIYKITVDRPAGDVAVAAWEWPKCTAIHIAAVGMS